MSGNANAKAVHDGVAAPEGSRTVKGPAGSDGGMEGGRPKRGKKKKEGGGFKSPNTYVLLVTVIVAMALLTWIIPGGTYEYDDNGYAIAGTYTQMPSTPQGLWDIVAAPILGMVGSDKTAPAITISLFILVFGAFMHMIDETSALKIGLKKLTEVLHDNINVLIAVLMTIMSFLGTVLGAYEDSIIYTLMFLPAFLAMGVDTLVVIMVVIGGTQIGCLASTVNPFVVTVASDIAGISPGNGLIYRVVIWATLTAIGIFMTCRYANRVRKDPEKSPQYFRREDDLKEFPLVEGSTVMTKGQVGVLVLFCVTILLMIMGLLPWSTLLPNFTGFSDFAAWIGATPVLCNIFGTDIVPFGDWYFTDLCMLLLVSSIIIGMSMKMKAGQIADTIIAGCGELLPVALVVPTARGIQVIMENGNILPTVLHGGELLISSLPAWAFLIVALVFCFVLACFVPSPTGLAAAVVPILASLSSFCGVPIPLMVTMYSMAFGLAKMVTPCSIAVMTCTQATHIGYTTWLRHIAPLLGTLFAACCVFLVIGLYV